LVKQQAILEIFMNRRKNPDNQNNTNDNKEIINNNNVDPIKSKVDQEFMDLKKLLGP